MTSLEKADRKLSLATEGVARKLSRRKLVERGMKGLVTTVAAVSVGGFVNVRTAFAADCTCSCSFPGCGGCFACRGKGCPSSGGCPSGCYICTSGDCPNNCGYSSGSWICCSGCGVCGFGYKACYDCRCTACNVLCGCKSDCICAGCCSPQQVKVQMVRDGLAAPV
jgi:hypothetical protein